MRSPALVRDGQVRNTPFYVVMGVTTDWAGINIDRLQGQPSAFSQCRILRPSPEALACLKLVCVIKTRQNVGVAWCGMTRSSPFPAPVANVGGLVAEGGPLMPPVGFRRSRKPHRALRLHTQGDGGRSRAESLCFGGEPDLLTGVRPNLRPPIHLRGRALPLSRPGSMSSIITEATPSQGQPRASRVNNICG